MPEIPEMVGRFECHELPDGSIVFYDPDPVHTYYTQVEQIKGEYQAIEETRLAGISSVAKGLDGGTSDGLLNWAARAEKAAIAHLFREKMQRRGVPFDTEWLASQWAIQRELEKAELTWKHVRDQAGTRGSNVHQRIFHALAENEDPPSLTELNEDERGYGQAAIKWWRDRKPEPIRAEQVTVDLNEGIAGRFDLLALLGDGNGGAGERTLVDAKTRRKPYDRRSDHVQLQGYEMANRACGVMGSERQLVLILNPDGNYREVECLADEQDFRTALLAWRRGHSLQDRMKEAA